MTTIKQNFTVLERGINPTISVLKDKLSIKDIEDEEWKKIKSVRIIGHELGGKDYEFDKDNLVLKIAKGRIDVIEAIKKELDLNQTTENEFYVQEKTSQDEKAGLQSEPVELTSEEEKSKASLGFLSDILDRAYNRRTTLTSWILYFVLGLKEDDFGPMADVLKDDSNFAKVYTQYREMAEKSKANAETYLANAFEKKDGDKVSHEEKQKLVRRASFLIDNYNKLNMGFVKIFPQVFCIQNIAMPFLKMLLPKVKFFDFMVTVNPWLYDLVSENMGNYAGEIGKIQKVTAEKETGEKVLSEVNLTPLSFEQFSLQKIIKNINNGFDRVFGKESTVSAMLAKKWLKRYRGMEYQEFAKQFTDDDNFIKKLYEGLKENADSGGNVPEGKFEKGTAQHWVAKIIWGITSGAQSITPKWIKEKSNTFGAIFVPLNLAMPLIAKVFNKGFLGFITHTLIKVFPIVNELVFDHVANFRKEILDVQKETSNKSISKLFKKIEVDSPYQAFSNSVKYLYNSIKEFASRKFSRKPAIT